MQKYNSVCGSSVPCDDGLGRSIFEPKHKVFAAFVSAKGALQHGGLRNFLSVLTHELEKQKLAQAFVQLKVFPLARISVSVLDLEQSKVVVQLDGVAGQQNQLEFGEFGAYRLNGVLVESGHYLYKRMQALEAVIESCYPVFNAPARKYLKDCTLPKKHKISNFLKLSGT